MSVTTLENAMIAAHKMGVLTFQKFGLCVEPHLMGCLDAHKHIFKTEAERMAFLAGYHGAKRRADYNGRTLQ